MVCLVNKKIPVLSVLLDYIGAKNGINRVVPNVLEAKVVGDNNQEKIFVGEVKTFIDVANPFVSVINVPSYVTSNQKPFLSFLNYFRVRKDIGTEDNFPTKKDDCFDVIEQDFEEMAL